MVNTVISLCEVGNPHSWRVSSLQPVLVESFFYGAAVSLIVISIYVQTYGSKGHGDDFKIHFTLLHQEAVMQNPGLQTRQQEMP